MKKQSHMVRVIIAFKECLIVTVFQLLFVKFKLQYSKIHEIKV